MPTNLEVINSLPGEYKEKAFNNTVARKGDRAEAYFQKPSFNTLMTLTSAFDWQTSPEGGAYWAAFVTSFPDYQEQFIKLMSVVVALSE